MSQVGLRAPWPCDAPNNTCGFAALRDLMSELSLLILRGPHWGVGEGSLLASNFTEKSSKSWIDKNCGPPKPRAKLVTKGTRPHGGHLCKRRRWDEACSKRRATL